MSTFNVFTAPRELTLEQKKEIADWCTTAYHDEFGIADYLIQVIFYEVARKDWYIAGKPAEPDVIWIRCDVREGRNVEMKARLLHRVQQGVAKIADVPEEAVWIYLCDLPHENVMEWGHIMPTWRPTSEPHNGDTWFQGLSDPFKTRLRALVERRVTKSSKTH